jgi:chemotaxis signal transduction protein
METAELPDLVFMRLGGKRFAFPAELTREVLPLLEPSPMPGWPLHALGAIDVRAELMPLVDVAAGLGLPPTALRPAQRIVVVAAAGRACGVLVDEVESVQKAKIDPGERVALPAVEVRPPSCLGVVALEGETVAVLAVEELLRALPEIGTARKGKAAR